MTKHNEYQLQSDNSIEIEEAFNDTLIETSCLHKTHTIGTFQGQIAIGLPVDKRLPTLGTTNKTRERTPTHLTSFRVYIKLTLQAHFKAKFRLVY